MSPLSLLRLPIEIQHEIVLAGIERTDLLCTEDSLLAMFRNRDYLKELVLVCRAWQELVTPLLYRTMALGNLRLELPPSSFVALLETLELSPGLRPLVRRLHYPFPDDDDESIRNLSSATIQLLPNLEAFSTFAGNSPLPPLDIRPRMLHVGLDAAYPDRWAGDADFDLSLLVRLDIDAITEVYGRLKPCSLPCLTDLRLSRLMFDEFLHFEELLQDVGPQLRTLHLFEFVDESDADADPRVINLDIPSLCPFLVDLGLNAEMTLLPDPPAFPAPGATVTATPWSSMRLNTLLLDDPSRYDPVPSPDGCLFWTREGMRDHACFKLIDRIRPKTVIIPDAPSTSWTPRDWSDARRLARVLRQDGRSIALEDKMGTLVEPESRSPSPGPSDHDSEPEGSVDEPGYALSSPALTP